MSVYKRENISGIAALAWIVEATDCTDQESWEAFRDAAADDRLHVISRKIIGRTTGADGDWRAVPLDYWKMAWWNGDLVCMTDACYFEVPRAEVERLWPHRTASTDAHSSKPQEALDAPTENRGGRPPHVANAVRDWYGALPVREQMLSASKLAESYLADGRLTGSPRHVRKLIAELKARQKPG